jgi:hypothetical protein
MAKENQIMPKEKDLAGAVATPTYIHDGSFRRWFSMGLPVTMEKVCVEVCVCVAALIC